MELELRQFVAEDIKLIYADAIEKELHVDFENVFSQAQYSATAGPAFTGSLGGKILGAGGINILPNKMDGRIWLIMRRDAVKHKKIILRAFFTMFPITVKQYNLRYVFADCGRDFKSAQRLIRHMKFTLMDSDSDRHFYRIDTRNLVPYGIKSYKREKV